MSTRPGRLVSGVNGALAVVLVALLAGFALVVNPPSPPGIAEFAPRATKPISEAPLGQSSSGGRQAGECLVSACPSPTPTAVKHVVPPVKGQFRPSSLQCYEWPDGSVTQTFDPQSPPCIASWDGRRGNGGGTASGVTPQEIRVAVVAPSYDPRSMPAAAASFARFFNSHFMLYGRKLRVVHVTAAASWDAAQAQRSLAADIAARHPFAALGIETSDPTTFEGTLGDRGVLVTRDFTVEGGANGAESLGWNWRPELAAAERNVAALLCSSLPPGERAVYAGGVEQTKSRAYGIIQPRYTDGRRSPDISALRDRLTSCGAKPVVRQVTYQSSATDLVAPQPEVYAQVMAAFRDQGVTSVVVFGGAGFEQIVGPMRAAESLSYQPEWIDPGVAPEFASQYISAPPNQIAHYLGVTPSSKQLPLVQRPYAQALREVTGRTTSAGWYADRFLYEQLQLIASGIQAAGPDLTAATFNTGLVSVRFPNPGAGRAPTYQASVGVGTRPHEQRALVNDYAVWWWSSRAREPEAEASDTGARCYAESGRRWNLDSWPHAPIPLFVPGAGC